MINIPKGTKDVLPQDSFKWQYIENIARETARLFNIKEIRTPVFEHTELFLRSIGGETDVVSKEMYTFLDKGNRSITLKPEGTAPVARSYVENALEQVTLPLKMFYITPVFRYERPQHGRLREHHQFGVEVYGSNSPFMDGEVISAAYNFLTKAGIRGVSLRLNSIGCNQCRGGYNDALRGFLKAQGENLCPECKIRAEHNPLRALDCKIESCKNILQNAPKITEYICDDCSNHMSELERYLSLMKIDYVIDSNIVRGLDYYTKTVFEFVTTELGAQGTICGGGRYDGMVESVGGKPTPCVGFGCGLERLLMLLEKMNVNIPDLNTPEIYIAPQSNAHLPYCLKLVSDIRAAGIPAETDFLNRSIKSQLKYADKIKAKYVVVIGEDEVENQKAEIKNMSASNKEIIKTNEIIEYLKRG